VSSSKSAKKRRRQARQGSSVVQQNEGQTTATLAGGLVAGVSQSISFSGPIPPPELLKQYDALIPGTAAKIIAMAESQTQHRIKMEDFVIKSDSHRANRGLVAGFIVAMATVFGGVGCVLAGHDTAGGTIATATVGALVGVFVYGTQSRRAERQQKANTMSRSK